MSNYYYGKMPKGPPPKTSMYKTGESCVVLTMEERVDIATLFSILLNVERRTKDGTKKEVAKQPKIKGSQNRGPFDLLQLFLTNQLRFILQICFLINLPLL